MGHTRDDWKYVAKKMREIGYTVPAISTTLDNMGHSVPLSTLYDNIRGIPASEFDRRLTEPLSFYRAMMLILDYPGEDNSSPDEGDSEKEDDSDYIVEDSFSNTPPLIAALDLSPPNCGRRPLDGFQLYYTTDRDGLGNYLKRCRQQDRQMETLPQW